MFCQKCIAFYVFAVLLVFNLPQITKSSLQGEEVARWANAIGNDLWMLGQTITRMSEIKEKYRFLNAKVGVKDPRLLLQEIKENILLMMDRKMDAIRCIQQKAEEVAETFEFDKSNKSYKYYSSKYSQIEGQEPFKLPKCLKKNKEMYLEMSFNRDTHFYNLPVNTNHSSVHVPTNVFDLEDAAAEAIQWSKELDQVFVQNYNSDPALSWQYFGSSSGIMRHYPAKNWEEHKKDEFDCRIRTWYIEAATCTKDVVILMDNSGSMDGMGKHIGALTVNSILNTFSNNDFVNVLNYSQTTNYVVPCFENMLVQATKENINIFKDAIEKLKPVGKTRLDQALEVAFDILSSYRELKGCNGTNSTCNQAIMVVTDGINGNLSDTVMRYNHLNGDANIPVRIFTYLIGKEVTDVEEVKWMSCANRGYYTHVQTLEQVTASVLQYINVIARPLVLQGVEHPVSWTHAYVDPTYDDANDNIINEPYRLLTSAAIPCFDRKINNMNDTKTAKLLGVAATDVPIDEFRKLTLPYKIGVNAYAFIVSNNGYVLMHPDLRPMFEKEIKENYNSIDLTEVEQLDNDLPPREKSRTLIDLRHALVMGEEGRMHDVKIKYHYDGSKRVSEETYDYYYAPLEESPFSIAIAIPNRYGNYSLDVGDEIQRNRHTGENLTSFFKGKWKIHPKWVYCKYHYLEGHEYDTPEEELLVFLKEMYKINFKWERKYATKKRGFGLEKDELNEVECGRKTLDVGDYYCDKQLVQRLIFDARNTYEPFKEKWFFGTNSSELPLFKKYEASLRFVATMSGLTRWEYIFEDALNESQNRSKKNLEFGDLHPRAIDEKWYKSAVLQHQYDTESFVYSVPFYYPGFTEKDALVTGSYAIFPSDADFEAPGSVVGFQFAQSKLKAKVVDLSTKLSKQCDRKCGHCNKGLDCYVVDSSGYVLVSVQSNDTGKFFGEIEGDILESMLEENIFKKKVLYDYQALCKWDDEPKDSSGCLLKTPLDYVTIATNWIFAKIMYFIMEVNLKTILNPVITLAQDSISSEDYAMYEGNATLDENDETDDDDDEDEEDTDDDEKNEYFACEKKVNLYILQQSLFIEENYHGEINRPGRRPYYVKRIPNSNLIFIAVNHTHVVNKPYYTTAPQKITKAPVWEINYINSTLLPCQKLDLNNLTRRRLTGCYNEHPEEKFIIACGKTPFIKPNIAVILISIISYIKMNCQF